MIAPIGTPEGVDKRLRIRPAHAGLGLARFIDDPVPGDPALFARPGNNGNPSRIAAIEAASGSRIVATRYPPTGPRVSGTRSGREGRVEPEFVVLADRECYRRYRWLLFRFTARRRLASPWAGLCVDLRRRVSPAAHGTAPPPRGRPECLATSRSVGRIGVGALIPAVAERGPRLPMNPPHDDAGVGRRHGAEGCSATQRDPERYARYIVEWRRGQAPGQSPRSRRRHARAARLVAGEALG